MKRTAIVLQGGAGLGAYECGAMKALYEARGKDFKPDIITGISSGAVNAVILAAAGIDALEETWRKRFTVWSFESLAPALMPLYKYFTPPIIQQTVTMLENQVNPGMFWPRPEYLLGGMAAAPIIPGFSDPTPLRQTLHDMVDFTKLNSGPTRVVLTATNLASGNLVTFDNRQSIEDESKHPTHHAFANHDGLKPEHVLGSGAFVPGYPPIWVNNDYVADGGFVHSTPLREALNAIERHPDKEAEWELIVVEVLRRDGPLPTNVPEAILRTTEILYANKLALDQKMFQKTNDRIDFARDVTRLEETIVHLEPTTAERPELQHQIEILKRTMTHIKEEDPGYQELLEHQPIAYFTMVPFTAGPELANGADFTAAAINGRIEAGYQTAKALAIGDYDQHRVPHTSLHEDQWRNLKREVSALVPQTGEVHPLVPQTNGAPRPALKK